MSFVSPSSPAERAGFVAMQREQREREAALRDEITRLTEERDRYLETLAWYAVAEPWEVSADGGIKAWEVLEATGKLPPELADADRAAYAEHVLPYEPRRRPSPPR